MCKTVSLLLNAIVTVSIVACSSGQLKSDFFRAVSSGDLVEIKEIARKHPSVKDAFLNDGWTALTIASREGNINAVNLLIDEGVDINRLEGGGNSALFWAVYYGHEDIVSVLLRNGARVDNKCAKCLTPLDVAREKKSDGILRQLSSAAGSE
jgi:ankyrin repeat protein